VDSVSSVGVLDKVVALLNALEQRGALGLGELQQAIGLPRATTHRLAVALEQHALVRRDAVGRFELGLGLIGLGRAAVERLPVSSVARPVMESLRDRTGEDVHLFVREGDARRCVVSLHSAHALRWIVPEGAVLPLDRGSAGRVLSRLPGRKQAPWVESVEERVKGVASVSAPVCDASGLVLAAVSVAGPVERLTRSPGRRFGAAVVSAAEEISLRLSSS